MSGYIYISRSHIDKSTLSLLFSMLNSPRPLSFALYDTCSSSLIIFVVLCWLDLVYICLSCTGEPRTGHSTQMCLTSDEQSGRITSFDLLSVLCIMQLRRWLSSCPQSVAVHGVIPLQVQHLALCFVDLHDVSVYPFPQLIEVPLNGIWAQPFGVLTTPHTLCSVFFLISMKYYTQ